MHRILQFSARSIPALIPLCLLFLFVNTVASSVPIEFTLGEPGYVTLVIEDASGVRTRNLIQETYFEAGTHTLDWDLYNEGNPINRGSGGNKSLLHDIERGLVQPGEYTVRGIVHQGLDLKYELSVQSPGDPAWNASSGPPGGWLADHSPPHDITVFKKHPTGPEEFLLVSSPVAEAGQGIVTLDLEGNKVEGLPHIQRGFLNSSASARDLSEGRLGIRHWSVVGDPKKRELYIVATPEEGWIKIATVSTGTQESSFKGTPDIAAYDNVLAVSTRGISDEIIFIDGTQVSSLGKTLDGVLTKISGHPLSDVRGLFADETGILYVIVGSELRTYPTVDWQAGALGSFETLVTGLEDPQRVLVRDDRIYISDWGTRHQIKIFERASGVFVKAIGAPGGPQEGAYDPRRMNKPNGFDIDSQGTLWVAESSFMPNRISSWDITGSGGGAFKKAWYGPPRYAGNGFIDPIDKDRFYYAYMWGPGTIEFDLDWENRSGNTPPRNLLYNAEDFGSDYPEGITADAPMIPYIVEGHRYLVNTQGTLSSTAPGTSSIWIHNGERIQIVALLHSMRTFRDKYLISHPDAYDGLLAWFDAKANGSPWLWHLLWVDKDLDGEMVRDEMQFIELPYGNFSGFVVNPDLSMVNMQGYYIPAPKVDPATGMLDYDITGAGRPFNAINSPIGYPAMNDKWFISAHAPIEAFDVKTGEKMWTYRDQYARWGEMWPLPKFKGEIIATEQIIGSIVGIEQGEAGEIFALNTYFGSIHFFTSDGLYIAEVFGDQRTTPLWRYPKGEIQPGDSIGRVSPSGETFYPGMSYVNGKLYLINGKEHSSVVRVDGLENILRKNFGTVAVASEDLKDLALVHVEPYELLFADNQRMSLNAETVVDGDLSEWDPNSFMEINWVGGWNWHNVETGYSAALNMDEENLYIAWKSENPDLLASAENNVFQSFVRGGGLDLYLRTSPNSTVDAVIPGDIRVFITRNTDGALLAGLYEKMGSGAPHTYTSPIDSVDFGRVVDISGNVTLAQAGGHYEVSIPLSVLSLSLQNGDSIQGDIGVVIGNGSEATSRLYWANKNDILVDDVYREADYSPANWGTLWVRDVSEPVEATNTYGVWQTEWFGPEATTDPKAQFSADFDGDGISNLEEYAMDLNPIVSDQRFRPQTTLVADLDGSWLASTYRWNLRADDLLLDFQTTAQPSAGWTSIGVDGTTVIDAVLDPDIDGDGFTQLRQVKLRRNPGEQTYLRLVFSLAEEE